MNKEMLKGNIDLILMSLISKKEMYGYEMVQALKQSSNDEYSMSEGTLYPALKRLELQEAIESFWVTQENGRPRKYYKLTKKGHKLLTKKLSDWNKINGLIMKWSNGEVAYD